MHCLNSHATGPGDLERKEDLESVSAKKILVAIPTNIPTRKNAISAIRGLEIALSHSKNKRKRLCTAHDAASDLATWNDLGCGRGQTHERTVDLVMDEDAEIWDEPEEEEEGEDHGSDAVQSLASQSAAQSPAMGQGAAAGDETDSSYHESDDEDIAATYAADRTMLLELSRAAARPAPQADEAAASAPVTDTPEIAPESSGGLPQRPPPPATRAPSGDVPSAATGILAPPPPTRVTSFAALAVAAAAPSAAATPPPASEGVRRCLELNRRMQRLCREQLARIDEALHCNSAASNQAPGGAAAPTSSATSAASSGQVGGASRPCTTLGLADGGGRPSGAPPETREMDGECQHNEHSDANTPSPHANSPPARLSSSRPRVWPRRLRAAAERRGGRGQRAQGCGALRP